MANPKPITTFRKQKARAMRKGMGEMQTEHGPATHLMASASVGKKTAVFPTITPTSPNNYKPQSLEEAYKKGEVFEFRNERKAEKFAMGSWKKGPARRDAMREYRQMRKEQRKNKGK
jgi:hypothetical protein